MDYLIIALSLVCAYVLFISVSYLLARLFFPKIEIDEEQERNRELRAKQRRMARAMR